MREFGLMIEIVFCGDNDVMNDDKAVEEEKEINAVFSTLNTNTH